MSRMPVTDEVTRQPGHWISAVCKSLVMPMGSFKSMSVMKSQWGQQTMWDIEYEYILQGILLWEQEMDERERMI